MNAECGMRKVELEFEPPYVGSYGDRRGAKLALLLTAVAALAAPAVAELRVPAFTAYLDPEPNRAKVSAKTGITDWRDSALRGALVRGVQNCRPSPMRAGAAVADGHQC